MQSRRAISWAIGNTQGGGKYVKASFFLCLAIELETRAFAQKTLAITDSNACRAFQALRLPIL